jgi:hypothetical protein
MSAASFVTCCVRTFSGLGQISDEIMNINMILLEELCSYSTIRNIYQ